MHSTDKKQTGYDLQISEEVFSIKQELMYNTILRYMESGTKDKTNQMLKALI